MTADAAAESLRERWIRSVNLMKTENHSQTAAFLWSIADLLRGDFNRHFYVFQPPRSLEEIDRDLQGCTDRIKQMIEELSA